MTNSRSGRFSHLESRLRVVPVGPHDEGLFREEFGDVDGVLLRPLVLVVVVHRAGEVDLRVVVDVAPHVKRALLKHHQSVIVEKFHALAHVHKSQKNQGISVVISRCKLQHGITQLILQLF